jgi:hypothetical protein
LKTFQPDMASFYTNTMKTGRIGEPSVARSNAGLFSTWFEGTFLRYTALDSLGVPMGIDNSMNFVTQPIVEVSVASGSSMVAVSAQADNTCEIYAVDLPGSTGGAGFIGGTCTEPYILGDGATTNFRMVYTNAGSIYTSLIVAQVGSIFSDGANLLGPGTRPQLARIGNVPWVVWKQATGLRMTPLDDFTEAPITGVPPGVPDAYQVAGDRVFAVWGTGLYAISCP